MKKTFSILIAVIAVLGFVLLGYGQIDVINHGTNLVFIAAANASATPLIAGYWSGTNRFIDNCGGVTNRIVGTNSPSGAAGNRVFASVSNLGSVTFGVKLGIYTNGANPDVVVPGWTTKILPLGGFYNGVISARSLSSSTNSLIYFEMGAPPGGFQFPITWISETLASLATNGDVAGTVVFAALSNGQQRTTFNLANTNNPSAAPATTNVGVNIGIRFAGSYFKANVATADLIIYSNQTYVITLPEAYNGALTAEAMDATNTPAMPSSAWGH